MRVMKSISIIIVSSLLIFSCRREYTVNYKVYICNESGKGLTVEYYRYGFVQEYLTEKSIQNGECRNVFSATGRGSTPTYGSETINMDSAIITFDDGNKMVHYGYFQKNGPSVKSYPSTHPRNIIGDTIRYGNRWVYKIISETKHSINDELKYTFTEQDYLDAQK
jgi:hypothetical protein